MAKNKWLPSKPFPNNADSPSNTVVTGLLILGSKLN